MKLPRLYYTLPELAEKWGKSENDLLHLAAAGELELSAIHESTGYCHERSPCKGNVSGYVQLESDSARRFLEFGFERHHEVMTVRWHGEKFHFPRPGRSSDPDYIFEERPVVIWRTSDLLILPDEVARVEAKFPELAGRNEAAIEAVDQAHEETIHPGILHDISQKELAKKCGVTTRTVRTWMKGGLLFESQGREKRFSLPLVIKWLKQNYKRNELETLNNSK